jgi:nucleotide-binding universal stress UspA family protein
MNASSDETSARRVAVVGVDSSLSAQVALEHAVRRVGPSGRVLVTHAVTPLESVVSGQVSELNDKRHAIAQDLVDRLVDGLPVDAEPVVVEGFAPDSLVAVADERGADEIVVGSRGLGRFAAALGSVSHALLEQARTPVVVVPQGAADHPRDPREHGACTVVVGYDGSEPARAALSYAARRAAGGGRVVAVHAFQPTPDWLGTPYYDRALAAYQSQGRERLRSLEEQGDLGAELTTSLLEGPPARAIIAAADARDADEIVIGSRGFGPVRGVLGSVSHAVLHGTDRAVVVIPAAAVSADAASA